MKVGERADGFFQAFAFEFDADGFAEEGEVFGLGKPGG